MIIKEGTALGSKTELKYSDGTLFKKAISFNTKSKEVKFYVCDPKTGRVLTRYNSFHRTNRDNKVVEAIAYVRDLKAFNKETGEEIL